MKRARSLEHKILCGQADRVADAEVAKIFLERVAMRPLKEYFQENLRVGSHIMEALGMGKEWENRWDEASDDWLTYGWLCGRLVRKRENGEELDNLLIRATVYRYAKGRSLSLLLREKKNATAKTDRGEEVFQKESLESRLEKADKAAKEEKTRREKETGYRRISLSAYYTRLEEEPAVSIQGDAFVINRINMWEYFQALSLITGKADDAKMPEILPFCENLTVEELLDEDGISDETYLERIYGLLIEPFAKIGAMVNNR